MVELTPEMLRLVNEWELQEHYSKNGKSIEKNNTKITKIIEEQLKYRMEVEKPKLTPHKERSSEKGYVKSLRKNDGRIEFWIYIHDEGIERWVTVEEVKNRMPIALCDYLLQKVKFGESEYSIQKCILIIISFKFVSISKSFPKYYL